MWHYLCLAPIRPSPYQGEARWGSFPTHKLIHLLPPPSTSTILLPITPERRAALQRPAAGVMPSRERRCSFGFELRP